MHPIMNSTSMSPIGTHDAGDCGCGGNACGCVPAEFTRLRYAYGLRLGAVELSDEQAYLVGKHRFHNARCHGAGILCGLKADRFVYPQGSPASTPSTVLRVSRGAALDQCGREILVPCDQCIDVAAWFGKNLAKLRLPADTGALSLRVALRYRECPSDPAPVPRDACGCDSVGCDYSRVREGFELALFADPYPACAGAVFPDADAILAALGRNASASAASRQEVSREAPVLDLPTALGAAAAEGCPTVSQDEWLCLADFTATLATTPGAAPKVSDISAPDNTIPGRHTLLSTAALQALILDLAGATDAQSVLAAGPTLGQPGFIGSGPDSGTLTLPVSLLDDSDQSPPTPLAEGTFLPEYLKVSVFDKAQGKWNPAPAPSTIGYDAVAGQFTFTWNPGSHLAEGNYRVSLLSPDDQPIVDLRMRPLRPARFARNFALAADKTNNDQLIWATISL